MVKTNKTKKSKVFIKVHFKKTWTEVSSGDIMNIKYSTKSVTVDDPLDAVLEAEKIVKETSYDFTENGVNYKLECIGKDVIEKKDIKLTKEQMFDFILNNTVTLTPSNAIWTDTSGKKVRQKYTVAINETGMSGFDLEDAINYYVNNRDHMK